MSIDNNAPHASTKIDEYVKKGYTASYKVENDQLIDLGTKIGYDKERIKICDEYRFEGFSNPSDLSILHILEMDDGSKGTILLPYGPMADSELVWFLKDVSQNKLNQDRTDLNKVSGEST